MKTLSVKLPDGLDAKLTVAARQRKTTKSTVVRKALEAALQERGKPKRGSALDLARDLVGCVAGPGDLSVNKAYFRNFGR
ncbi:MAG TPA: CopG family transcriptional regulator [Methylomirabilota bacterium]|jgi:Arc/MetJ-type ribon-helix-helix transcriptional regulator|nr:CopG family transcriptional regulator [Methylomirabilota bacterium]